MRNWKLKTKIKIENGNLKFEIEIWNFGILKFRNWKFGMWKSEFESSEFENSELKIEN